MTEKDFREQLKTLVDEMPPETHRAFLSAVTPGKEEKIMKKKFSVGLLVAILVSVVLLAFAAAEIIQSFTLNWAGEKVAQDEHVNENEADSDMMGKLLAELPEDKHNVVSSAEGASAMSTAIRRYGMPLEELEKSSFMVPKNIPDGDYRVDLVYGCDDQGEYQFVSRTEKDGYIISEYTIEPEHEVIAEYFINFLEGDHITRMIKSRLESSSKNKFHFRTGDDVSYQQVEISGMEEALYIVRGDKTTLIMCRKLDEPVLLRTAPDGISQEEEEMTTLYPYELITMTGFSLEEGIAMFAESE